MARIIKGNDISDSASPISVGMVTDISVYKYSDTVNRIRWTNPEDVIINGAAIAEFGGVNVIISPNHIPEDKEDFSLSNGDYSISIEGGSPGGVGFADINVNDYNFESGNTYYIRIFTRTTEGVYNNDPSGIYVYTPISTTLSDNNWGTIIEVANRGEGQNYWQVGDEIQLQLSGYYNVTCTLQIYDFNHFDKSDGTGKANICFGCKDVYIIDRMYKNASNTMGWMGTDMKNDNMNNILNSMPSVLQSAIKEVEILYNKGRSTTLLTSNDKVFLPSLTEIGLSSMSSVQNCGSKFPIFTDTDSMVKYNVETGYNYHYWTRNAATGSSYGYYFISTIKLSTGDFRVTPNTRDADTDSGVVFCFNI